MIRIRETMRLAGKAARAILLLALVASCSGPASGQPAADKPNPALRTVDIQAGTATVKAEVAATETERNRGLMFRKSLADGRGMLFVFEKDQQVSFWMKNTVIPLSLAYIAADGTITQILDLAPGSLEPRASERSVRYALEVPAGWFGRAGISVGTKVVIPDLRL